MGLPKSNEIGYISSNVMTHVEKMTGKILLIHGLIDENVHSLIDLSPFASISGIIDNILEKPQLKYVSCIFFYVY